MKSDLYLKHDLYTMSDPKIMQVLRNHGATGYGLFWAIVEQLYKSHTHKMAVSELVSILSFCFQQLQPEDIEYFLNDCNKWNLFIIDKDGLYSERILDEFAKREEYSRKQAKSINVRWNKVRNAKLYDRNTTEIPNNTTEIPNNTTEIPNNTTEIPINNNKNKNKKSNNKENVGIIIPTSKKENEKNEDGMEGGMDVRENEQHIPQFKIFVREGKQIELSELFILTLKNRLSRYKDFDFQGELLSYCASTVDMPNLRPSQAGYQAYITSLLINKAERKQDKPKYNTAPRPTETKKFEPCYTQDQAQKNGMVSGGEIDL